MVSNEQPHVLTEADRVRQVFQNDFGGLFYLTGNPGDNGAQLRQWDLWLTLAHIAISPRSAVPQSASIEARAVVGLMEKTRAGMCDGVIVITSNQRQPDASESGPYLSFADYNLILQLFSENKDIRIYTTEPLCAPDVEQERACKFDSLDPESPDTLYRFTWDDFRARFYKNGNHRKIQMG